ncbi:hypothetical protein RF55_12251 [Lasius niger]|uniref:Uncharacterized protein n=1 Tax=Lasius niger TaxID=67767 RepID=A0A0J7KD61_LASNI|nr:hypothetical protein RF55_12251 [Lasius niger]
MVEILGKALKRSVATRWNSLSDCLKQLIKLRDKLLILFIEKFVKCTEPIAEAFDILQGEVDVAAGSCIADPDPAAGNRIADTGIKEEDDRLFPRSRRNNADPRVSSASKKLQRYQCVRRNINADSEEKPRTVLVLEGISENEDDSEEEDEPKRLTRAAVRKDREKISAASSN